MKNLFPLLFVLPGFLFAEEGSLLQNTGLQQTILMIVLLVLFFYFILFRPERKRRKKMEQMRSEMKKGDKITAMGIVGTLDKINDKTVILKMIDGAKIEFLKAAISEVESQGGSVEQKT